MPYIWVEECQSAFETLKAKLALAPILGRPDFSEMFIIETDASNTGLGAVLLQRIKGEERVIAYASHVLTKHELIYSTSEKECLAIFWSVTKKFRCFVEGTKFKVITDHDALKWLIMYGAVPTFKKWV